MTACAGRVPIIIVTGFLGSGKTTLLNHLLREPALCDAAVLVNEFGEIGLDHQWIEAIAQNTVLLASGCVCCTIRDDLRSAVLELQARRACGAIPPYRRLVIETTGLADPAPIIATFMSDPELRYHYRVALVIATVDAVNGLAQLSTHDESLKQVAVADRIVITKSDLVEPLSTAKLRQRLTAINPVAEMVIAIGGAVKAEQLLSGDVDIQAHRDGEVARWQAAAIGPALPTYSRHADDISAFAVVVTEPLDWIAFGIWLTMLLHCHGRKVLRVKGMLQVRGVDVPVVINGVQHLVHPPLHLARWPDHDRRSRIVFIVQGLARATIEHSLATFNRCSALIAP